MRDLLEKLVSGEIPNEDTYTHSDLKDFCTSLIKGQRNDMVIMKYERVLNLWRIAKNDAAPRSY